MRIGFVNRLKFIRKAFSATKHEMLISLGIVLALTVVLSLIFYIAESIAQPEVYHNYWDALIWAYTRYIEGGDGVFEGGPVTVTGKVIAALLGMIGIAVVAVPAGLVGSGFMDAIADEKRREELEQLHHRMLKQYTRFSSPAFRDYCRTQPAEMSEVYLKARFMTRAVNLTHFQTRMGMDFKDIADVCNTYPELRLRDMADEISDEEHPVSSLCVELLPVNSSYGCFINRHSDVTIMVTNGFDEMGTSWYGYHIALLGGFNFICKNQEADPDERDSFYALKENPSAETPETLAQKKQLRADFMHDLQSLSGKGKWVINTDIRRTVAIYLLADCIRKSLIPQQHLSEDNIRELQSKSGYGYSLKA